MSAGHQRTTGGAHQALPALQPTQASDGLLPQQGQRRRIRRPLQGLRCGPVRRAPAQESTCRGGLNIRLWLRDPAVVNEPCSSRKLPYLVSASCSPSDAHVNLQTRDFLLQANLPYLCWLHRSPPCLVRSADAAISSSRPQSFTATRRTLMVCTTTARPASLLTPGVGA